MVGLEERMKNKEKKKKKGPRLNDEGNEDKQMLDYIFIWQLHTEREFCLMARLFVWFRVLCVCA